MAQLLVVFNIYPYFIVVLLDGVAESFFGTLILMPLIVMVAKGCRDGVEGSLYALMMAISNLSGIIGNWLGTLIGYSLSISRTNFNNMGWFIILCSCCGLAIPLLFILRGTSSFYEDSEEESSDDLDRTLEPEDPVILESKQVTSEILEDNKRAMSVNIRGFWGKRLWKYRHVDSDHNVEMSVNKQATSANPVDVDYT